VSTSETPDEISLRLLLADGLIHAILELVEGYHSVSICVCLLEDGRPQLLVLGLVVAEDVLQFWKSNMTILVLVKDIEGELQILLAEHLLLVSCSRQEFRVVNFLVPINIQGLQDVFVDLLVGSDLPEDLFETFRDFFEVNEPISAFI